MSEPTAPSPSGPDPEDRAADALLSASANDADIATDPLAGPIAALRALRDREPPLPSAELAELLEHGLPAAVPLAGSSRRRKIATGVIIGGLASMGLTGVAAATNQLPGPAQRIVRSVVNDLTPFHLGPVQTDTVPSDRATTVPARPGLHPTAPLAPGSSEAGGSDEPGSGGPGLDGPGPGSSGGASSDDRSSPTPSEADETTASGDGRDGDASDPSRSAEPTKSGEDGSHGSGDPDGGGHSGP